MGIFHRKNYTEIGKTAEAEQFSQAFQKASSRKKRTLAMGAIEAFRAGHPENIREALSASSREFSDQFTADMLRQLSEGSNDKSAAIDSAFAGTAEEAKKVSLDKVLKYVVCRSDAEEPFVAALLKSGADANAEYNGFAGSLLALSVCNNCSSSVSQLLLDNGASAEGALDRARTKGYKYSYIKTLKGYEAKAAENKPVADIAPDADLRELILQVRDEVRALNEKVDRVLSLNEEPDASQPEEANIPAVGLKLRTVNKGP